VIRLILLLALLLAGLIVYQQLKNTPANNAKALYGKWLLMGGGLLLVALALTGRIHWIGVMIGAVLPFARRAAPLLIRFFPQIHQYFKTRKRPASAVNQSQVNTLVLAMTLDHDSHQLNGTVIAGPLAGSDLDALSLQQLQGLLEYCYQQDSQSAELLLNYLQHRFGDSWQSTAASGDSQLSLEAAYAVLGLQKGANKDEVVKAHRSMMQKMHPDRGGSDYLAAQINEAKAVIFTQLS
jgi:hypothetical protein